MSELKDLTKGMLSFVVGSVIGSLVGFFLTNNLEIFATTSLIEVILLIVALIYESR